MSPTSHRDKSVIACITAESLTTTSFSLQHQSHNVNLHSSLSIDTLFYNRFMSMTGRLIEFEMLAHMK